MKKRFVCVALLLAFALSFVSAATSDFGNTRFFARDAINQKAVDVAVQLDLFLEANPDMALDDLKNSERFNQLAVQKVGDTGYTYVIVYETGILEFHPDSDVQGQSYNIFRNRFVDIWNIIDETIGSEQCVGSSGFYDFEDINDFVREKYTSHSCLNRKTADGYTLFVGASTYLDEYALTEEDVVPLDSELVSAEISRELEFIEQDLEFLATMPGLRNFLNNVSSSDLDNLNNLFLNFAKTKPYYYQVRYIDESGREVVRVDNIDSPQLVSGSDLQDKSDRYYFQNSVDIGFGEVYVSPFDLNIENGALENRGTENNPVYVPVVRYATPVQDSFGNNRGIVVLNVYGSFILDLVEPFRGRVYMTNRFGEFLFHPDKEKEFGFSFGEDYTIEREFNNEISQQIFTTQSGTFDFDGKIFFYDRIYFPDDDIYTSGSDLESEIVRGKNYFWVIIFEEPKVEFFSGIPLWGYFIFAFFILTILAVVISFIIDRRTGPIRGLSLRKRIFIYISVLGLIFILSSGIFYYLNSVSNLKNAEYNHLATTVDDRARHVETYLEALVGTVATAATHSELTEEELIEIRDLNPGIHSLYVLDSNGIITNSSGETICGGDLSGNPVFLRGLKETILINRYFCKTFNQEMMAIATPHAGGVLVARISRDVLMSILEDRTGLGETGEVLVAINDYSTGEGVYLFERLFEKDTLDGTNPASSLIVRTALAGQNSFFEKVVDYRGVNVIAYSRYIQIADMGIVVKVDYDEIVGKPSRNLFYTLLLLVLAGLIISLVFSYVFSKRIINPILALDEGASKLRKGDFDARVDIKTRDELELVGESFNKMAEALGKTESERKKIDKMKTEFLSITSHELRSPMTPMRAQLQMLIGDYFGKLNPRQKASVDVVLRNTERLDGIIVDFLEISRIEAARLKFNFKNIDVVKVVSRIVQEMKGFMPEKRIMLETRYGKMPLIEADPDRIGQVLRNLINNAIKFTPEGGKIVVEAGLKNGRIMFSVSDNGIGIGEEDQKRLFEPFYQVENMYQHKSGGTGLGLAICRGIVESQNGKIWIESAPSKGTKFSFTVPLKPVREAKAIKLLFSEKSVKDDDVKKVFVEYLGPMGEGEFEFLKKTQGVDKNGLKSYFDFIGSKKILGVEKLEEFKNKCMLIVTGDFGRAGSIENSSGGKIRLEELKKTKEEKDVK